MMPRKQLWEKLPAFLRNRLGKLSRKDMIIGEVLKRQKIINDDQLTRALQVQKERLAEQGQAVPLGMIIVDLGYAAEKTVVDAINAHYRISAVSLSDNIKDLVGKVRGSFVERLPWPRLPIWLQLSVMIMLLVVITATSLNFFIFERQKKQLYNKTLQVGLVSLNYFDNNARIPLLEDDLLQLNTLVKNAAQVEGILYAVITDNTNTIKAHTDLNRIGSQLNQFAHVENVQHEGRNTYFNHTLSDGQQVLNISRAIMFQDKTLGEVHVGVSIDFIQHLIDNERHTIFLITLVIILIGFSLALLMGFRYSRPIKKLVLATHEISRGNYQHRVYLNRQDELGNLGRAFNRMGEELWRNSLMQKSFGKYVGSEVLEMILADPERTWLKGRRNEATILFVDIRGFTAFSDEKEPEAVVVILNHYFEIVSRTIMEWGGYVDKFMGDAVLGVFGVPVFYKNHVKRGLQAAVAIQKKLRQAGEDDNKLLARVGIGIDTGVVVSGNLGSQDKMEYTVIGNSVNTASRINGLAGSGEILISKNVYDKVTDIATADALPAQKIKGFTEPVVIFKVLTVNES